MDLRKVALVFSLSAAMAGTALVAQQDAQGAKQAMKNAGQDTKSAAKDTGSATKKTAKKDRECRQEGQQRGRRQNGSKAPRTFRQNSAEAA